MTTFCGYVLGSLIGSIIGMALVRLIQGPVVVEVHYRCDLDDDEADEEQP